jgi:hypothetical protein
VIIYGFRGDGAKGASAARPFGVKGAPRCHRKKFTRFLISVELHGAGRFVASLPFILVVNLPPEALNFASLNSGLNFARSERVSILQKIPKTAYKFTATVASALPPTPKIYKSGFRCTTTERRFILLTLTDHYILYSVVNLTSHKLLHFIKQYQFIRATASMLAFAVPLVYEQNLFRVQMQNHPNHRHRPNPTLAYEIYF